MAGAAAAGARAGAAGGASNNNGVQGLLGVPKSAAEIRATGIDGGALSLDDRSRALSVNIAKLLASVSDEFEVALDLHKDFRELATVDSILQHPVALAHFKAYLQHGYCVESLDFYNEVERFRGAVCAHANRLYSGFSPPATSLRANQHPLIRARERVRLFGTPHRRLVRPRPK